MKLRHRCLNVRLALLLVLGFWPAAAGGQTFVSTGTSSGLRLYYPNSNDWWLDPSGGRLDIRADGGPALASFLTNGFFGIGTANSVMALQVDNGTQGNPAVTGTTPTGVLRLRAGSNAVLDFGLQSSGWTGAWMQATDRTGLSAAYTLALNPNGGNVGISTTSAYAKLHVNGMVGMSGLNSPLAISNNVGADLADFDFNGLGLMTGGVVTNPGRLMRFDNRSGQPAIQFWTRPANTAYPAATGLAKLVIMEGGNVGIGNVSPTQVLDVTGIVNAQAFYVNGSPFAGGASQWTTSGSSIYYNAGNVGVGTTNPAAPLSIWPTGDNQDKLTVYDDGVTYRWGITKKAGIGATLFVRGPATGFGITYQSSYASTPTSDNVALYATSSGNVGVGTINPASRLHVSSATLIVDGSPAGLSVGVSTFVVTGGNVGVGASSPGAVLDVNGLVRSISAAVLPTAGTGSYFHFNGASGYFGSYNWGSSLWLPTHLNGSVLSLNADSGGNVGVGTTAPQAQLEVVAAGSSNAEFAHFFAPGIATNGVDAYMVVGRSASTANAATFGYQYNTVAGNTGAFLGVYGDGVGTGLFVQKGGNVGIGTNNPSAGRLYVQGPLGGTSLLILTDGVQFIVGRSITYLRGHRERSLAARHGGKQFDFRSQQRQEHDDCQRQRERRRWDDEPLPAVGHRQREHRAATSTFNSVLLASNLAAQTLGDVHHGLLRQRLSALVHLLDGRRRRPEQRPGLRRTTQRLRPDPAVQLRSVGNRQHLLLRHLRQHPLSGN